MGKQFVDTLTELLAERERSLRVAMRKVAERPHRSELRKQYDLTPDDDPATVAWEKEFDERVELLTQQVDDLRVLLERAERE